MHDKLQSQKRLETLGLFSVSTHAPTCHPCFKTPPTLPATHTENQKNMFRRLLSTVPPPHQPPRVSFPAPPRFWLNVRKRNAIVGISIVFFVGGVFYYTLHQLRNANHLGAEFDEKLDKSKKQ